MMHRLQQYTRSGLHLVARARKKIRSSIGLSGSRPVHRWGIIGCGNIAASFARGLVYLPDAELRAAASRQPGKSDSFVRHHDGKKAYQQYGDLLADPEVDIVYVATPHNLHYRVVRQCLEAGKHVLCEKPFTLNVNEAKDLIHLATANNLFLMEAMWTRFLPAIRGAVKAIQAGDIGEIRNVSATFGFFADVGPSHRLLNRDLAGGALLDIGVYPVSFIRMICRENPMRITSSARIGPTGVDLHCQAGYEFANGATAQMAASIESPLSNLAIVSGTKGEIRIPSFWQSTEWTSAINGRPPTTTVCRYPSTGLQFEAREVMDCLNLGRRQSDIMPLDDTLAVIKQMDEMRKSWGLLYPGESI